MLPETWRVKTVGDICDLQNGNGFEPREWSDRGLPIIRIQNLNGSQTFNYFAGTPEPQWLVEPGQLLFAWAGTKGVSFGPMRWNGVRGVLNQHIFKVVGRNEIDGDWLLLALRHVTDRIEQRAHGFKATLLHVKKSDIEQQTLATPPQAEQRRIAETISAWTRAIEVAGRLVTNSKLQLDGWRQRFFAATKLRSVHPVSWPQVKASDVFRAVSRRRNGNEELLAVTQDKGVVPRRSLERRVAMPTGSIESYKLVLPGDFVISLRSFQGGLEYSEHRGVVSPAYTVLEPTRQICHAFYRHYFKSHEFIGRLAVAVIGIRDGKQISYDDFSFQKIPLPPLAEQERAAATLDKAERGLSCSTAHYEFLKKERQILMRQLLTGKRRVKLESEAAPEPQP